ncbi:hypothetical protein BH09BAC1_BH09BAC1_22040 [soil metagenome]
MKIKLLFVTALLGLGQLVNAQTKAYNVSLYEPTQAGVKVNFEKGYTTSEQKALEGNRVVTAYEQGLHYTLSITTVFPLSNKEQMGNNIDSRFMKMIADQAKYFENQTGKPLVPVKQMVPGQSGFATSFAIGDYTYAYRVIVIDNVYYMLAASSLTSNKTDKAITAFFNSFSGGDNAGAVKAPVNTPY